jgi:hypothetical protein
MYALAIDISDVGYGFGEVRGVSPVGWEGFGSGNGIIAVPLGLEAVLVDFSRICLGWVHFDVGRRGRPRRGSQLIALAARVVYAKIVLRVLVEILGGNSISVRRRFACQSEVALEYLVGAAADLDVGAVAVECLIVLRDSRLRFKRAVCVKATARPVIWPWSHVIRDVGIDPAPSFVGPLARLSGLWLAVATTFDTTFDELNALNSRNGNLKSRWSRKWQSTCPAPAPRATRFASSLQGE